MGKLGGAVFNAAASNVVRQGVNLAFGQQKTFSWAGLAASGVAGGIGYEVAGHVGGLPGVALGGAAAGLASAATRSLLTGQDLGKSIREALPDIIGSTIGDMITYSMTLKSSSPSQGASAHAKEYAAVLRAAYDAHQNAPLESSTELAFADGPQGRLMQDAQAQSEGSQVVATDVSGVTSSDASATTVVITLHHDFWGDLFGGKWNRLGSDLAYDSHKFENQAGDAWHSVGQWFDRGMRKAAQDNQAAVSLHENAQLLSQMHLYGAARGFDIARSSISNFQYNVTKAVTGDLVGLAKTANNLSPWGQLVATAQDLGVPVDPNLPNANDFYRPAGQAFAAASNLYDRFQNYDPTLIGDGLNLLKAGNDRYIAPFYHGDPETGAYYISGDAGSLAGHTAFAIGTGALGRVALVGDTANAMNVVDGVAAESMVPSQLLAGKAAEVEQLSALGAGPKVSFTPTYAQIDSAAFKVIVGEAKYTSEGVPVGTIYDGTVGNGLGEIKTGTTPLDSSYQLRLQTYGSLVNDTRFTIYTNRPVNPTFNDWLTRWSVDVKPLPKP